MALNPKRKMPNMNQIPMFTGPCQVSQFEPAFPAANNPTETHVASISLIMMVTVPAKARTSASLFPRRM